MQFASCSVLRHRILQYVFQKKNNNTKPAHLHHSSITPNHSNVIANGSSLHQSIHLMSRTAPLMVPWHRDLRLGQKNSLNVLIRFICHPAFRLKTVTHPLVQPDACFPPTALSVPHAVIDLSFKFQLIFNITTCFQSNSLTPSSFSVFLMVFFFDNSSSVACSLKKSVKSLDNPGHMRGVTFLGFPLNPIKLSLRTCFSRGCAVVIGNFTICGVLFQLLHTSL